MKVGLIAPPFTFGKQTKTIAPPLGLASIAAVLLENNIEVKIHDAYVLNSSIDGILEWVRKNKFDIIGIAAVTLTLRRSYEILNAIKSEFDVITVMGGPQATVDSIKSMEDCKSIDFLIRGEGEYTMLEIIKNLDSPEKVKGIVYRKDGNIVRNEDRPFIEDLDELPMPARELLEMNKYKPIPGSYIDLPAYHMIVTRGCPFRCLYCSRIFGTVYRKRSPEKVVDEMRILKEKYGAKAIVFQDDLITFNLRWLEKLCDLMIKEKLDLTWFAHARINIVNRDILRKMKRAGCFKVGYGIESADKEVLEIIKKDIKIEQTKEVFDLTHKLGIKTLAYFMLGLPGDSWRTCLKTVDFALELNPDTVNFNITTPFPGTELAENVDKYGKVYGDISRFTNDDAVFAPHGMTPDNLEFIRKYGLKKFYFRRKYILKKLKEIRDYRDLANIAMGLKSLVVDNLGFNLSKGDD